MSLTVKAFVGEGKDCEIRRFAVDPGVSTNFEYLISKITQVFPCLKGKKFCTFWKDPDGDLVSFSSGEELVEALGFVSDGVFRIYVRLDREQDRTFHPGVVCDGCQGPIYGSRYKCAVCPDYDLCHACEAKDMHSEHVLMRLRSPQQKHQIMKPWMAFGHPNGPPGPPHGPAGPSGPHHGPPGPPGPHHGPPGPPGPHGEDVSYGHGFHHWRRAMRQMWRRWWRENSGYMPPHCPSETGKAPEAGATDAQDKDEENTETQKTAPGSNGEQGNDEYLRSVGDSVAAMLDPLGIDVEIDVEHKGRRRGCRRGGRQGPFGWRWGRGAWRGFGEGAHPGMSRGSSCSDESSNHSSINSAVSAAANAATVARDIEMDTEADVTKRRPASNDQALSRDRGTGNRESPMSPETNEQGDVDWTLIDVSIKKEPSTADNATTSSKQTSSDDCTMVADKAPATQNAIQEVPAHIMEPLQNMLSMGFNNDDGWLTRLLLEKDGNISQALDTIQQASRGK